MTKQGLPFAFLCLACSSGVVLTRPEYRGPWEFERAARFALLGNDVTTLVFDQYPYDFAKEPNPSEADLFAVRVMEPGVQAFGDGGTILARTEFKGWARIESPTTQRLRGITKQGDSFVVGDHGTWLSQDAMSHWMSENTGIDEDLYAVVAVADRAFAVGDHGVMIERTAEGRFVRIKTRTDARLRDIGHQRDGSTANHGELLEDLYLVGDGGTIIDCSLRMEPPVCIPRASPTRENLMQVMLAWDAPSSFHDAAGRRLVEMILGSDGTLLGATLDRIPPYDFATTALRPPLGAERLIVQRSHGIDGKVRVNERLVSLPVVFVGPDTGVTVMEGAKSETLRISSVKRLHAGVSSALDLFAVGDHGAIVHATIRGARERIPIAVAQ